MRVCVCACVRGRGRGRGRGRERERESERAIPFFKKIVSLSNSVYQRGMERTCGLQQRSSPPQISPRTLGDIPASQHGNSPSLEAACRRFQRNKDYQRFVFPLFNFG